MPLSKIHFLISFYMGHSLGFCRSCFYITCVCGYLLRSAIICIFRPSYFLIFVIYFFYDGFAAQFIQIDFDGLSGKMVVIGIGLGMFCFLKFANNVLDTDRQLPKIKKLRIIAEASTLVYVVVAVILPYSTTGWIGASSVVILFSSMFISSIYFSIKHQRQAYFLLISFIIVSLGFIMVNLARLGILPSTPLNGKHQ
jgi:hypothetical protein